MIHNELNELTDVEIEQLENTDFTPISDLYEPIPQWKKDVDKIIELLS